jgi:F-box and leucine-rich repeat protein 10/11
MSQELSARDKILNVISLEVSGTKLGEMITPPQLVRDLDWVENCWPPAKKGKGHAYPKVQLYCLMGVANAFTVGFSKDPALPFALICIQDWHIDFAGSSVYYHIVSGSKVRARILHIATDANSNYQVFYFIRPTPSNLQAYEKWCGSELQNQTWLGDLVDEVYRVELVAGNTMIIPTGWIHAVVSLTMLHYEVTSESHIRNSTPQLTPWCLVATFCIPTMSPLVSSPNHSDQIIAD